MLQSKYLIRLDDACPTMDAVKWQRMEDLLDAYKVKPMVGIIPNCQDPQLMQDESDPHFWEKAFLWQEKGWTIAMHGYDHCYISDQGMSGLNPMWERSEFAGVPLEKQREKIRYGIQILKAKGIHPKFFFAPSHTFDQHTLTALREESDIRIISDTIGRYPYKMGDFWLIPQIVGHCVKMPISGIYTFCFHPNMMDDAAFEELEKFLHFYADSFVSFDQIDLYQYGKKGMIDRLLSHSFFFYRKLKGLR